MDHSSAACPWALLFAALLVVAFCGASKAEGPRYGVASWPENMGNHRARVNVHSKADAVRVHIPWRRHDAAPQDRNIVVVESSTGKQITNLARVDINREYGDIVFQPSGPGEYDIYYMLYSPVEQSKDEGWLAGHVAEGRWKTLPEASLIEIQARSEFERFDPMEVIASRAEVDDLLKRTPLKTYLLFPEDRARPVKMADFLPQKWIRSGPSNRFAGEAARGEFYTFQVGVWAARRAIADVSAACSGLRPVSGAGAAIPGSEFQCLNLGGVDWLGRPVDRKFAVEQGRVRALWFGVQIPKDAAPGEYVGAVSIKPDGGQESRVELAIRVTEQVLDDCGDSDLWRMSRLRWLNSTIGLEDEIVAPYTPIQYFNDDLKLLGRRMHFAATGLPSKITSNDREILARPVDLVVQTEQGRLKWSSASAANVIKESKAEVIREAGSWSGPLKMACLSETDFDGYTNYRLVLSAKSDVRLKDVSLEIPIRRDVAVYMMGLGRKGGYRPTEWKWTWDIDRANNQIWIGDADAGLQCKLKGSAETWDIQNLRASGLPDSWSNGGRGGCTVTEEGEAVVVRAYTGERELKQGQSIEFRFGLLITPVKPLDPAHFDQRYYHAFVPPETAAAVGANIINVHHGNPTNPYINYPFLATDKLAEYVKQAHQRNIKVKLYYTVRELSNHTAELWALRSFGDEVFLDGPGGGYAWLQEHLVDHYAPAWLQRLDDVNTCAAIATTGLSRWHNYYLEGLQWLLANVQIDGLYLDGIGYDREVMKRLRRVMERSRPGSLIDFHSGNEYVYQDWRISPACKYMEHFPYIDSLWFGEMYDYNESPDYWLVEVSGIPFGLFGEMLQAPVNPWRGMLYGMTGRYYGGEADPQHIWKLWDEFGIREAKMTGYWCANCPVKTGNKDIPATVYSRQGSALISLASWAKEPTRVKLDFDWSALGLDPGTTVLAAPAIPGFQEAASFQWSSEIPVEPGKGWLLLLKQK